MLRLLWCLKVTYQKVHSCSFQVVLLPRMLHEHKLHLHHQWRQHYTLLRYQPVTVNIVRKCMPKIPSSHLVYSTNDRANLLSRWKLTFTKGGLAFSSFGFIQSSLQLTSFALFVWFLCSSSSSPLTLKQRWISMWNKKFPHWQPIMLKDFQTLLLNKHDMGSQRK